MDGSWRASAVGVGLEGAVWEAVIEVVDQCL